MFKYAKKEYDNAIKRKQDIRSRASSFLMIGFTFVTAIVTIISYKNGKELSNLTLILLVISMFFLLFSLISFLIIYSPSSQKLFLAHEVMNELRDIEFDEVNKEIIEYYLSKGKPEYIIAELSCDYVADCYAKNVIEINKKISFIWKFL